MGILSATKTTINWIIKLVVILVLYSLVRKVVPLFADPISIAIIDPPNTGAIVLNELTAEAFGLALASDEPRTTLEWLRKQLRLDVVRPVYVYEDLSDPATRKQVSELLEEEAVEAAFGCVSSACVRSTLPIMEDLGIPLFYPRQHEGGISDQNVIHIGPLPSQQILPAVHWALENLGNRVYILGTNNVYSRLIGQMITEEVLAAGGEITHSIYYGHDQTEVREIPKNLRRDKTDVVLNIVEGSMNVALVKQAYSAEDPGSLPSMLFLTEDLAQINRLSLFEWDGYYVATVYNENNKSEANQRFKNIWEQHTAGMRFAGASEAAAFAAIALWREARRKVFSGTSTSLMDAIPGTSAETPFGNVTLNWGGTQIDHRARIIRIDARVGIKPVWQSDKTFEGTQYGAMDSEEVRAFLGEYEAETSGTWRSSQRIDLGADHDRTEPAGSSEATNE